MHEGAYGVRMTDKGIPEFTDPAGNPIPTVGAKNLRGNVFTLRHENRKAGLDITPETTIPLWEGEIMDDGMAVEGLLWFESPENAQPDARETT